MDINQLTALHVKEFGNLEKQQATDRQNLLRQHQQEIQQKGNSPELERKQQLQRDNLSKSQAQQRAAMQTRHETELAQFQKIKAHIKSAEKGLVQADQEEMDYLKQKREKANEEYERLKKETEQEVAQEKEAKVQSLFSKFNTGLKKDMDFEKKIQEQVNESAQNPSVEMTGPEFLETLKQEKEAKVQELLAKMNKGREIDKDLTQEKKPEQKQESKQELTNDLSLEEEKARKTKELLEQFARNREHDKDRDR